MRIRKLELDEVALNRDSLIEEKRGMAVVCGCRRASKQQAAQENGTFTSHNGPLKGTIARAP
jgi:hypothetical protein